MTTVRGTWVTAVVLAVGLVAAGGAPVAVAATTAARPAGPDSPTTAWDGERLAVDRLGLVSRSDVVLERPNRAPRESLPLGNGTLGAAAWTAEGLTVQLNRADTLPLLLTPGQVVVPGLEPLVSASDFAGRLDLTEGTLVLSGGGMTARVLVAAGADALVVDVAGAEPGSSQTAELRLPEGRTPVVTEDDGLAALSQTLVDDAQTDPAAASGQRFGVLGALTARGDDVAVVAAGPRTLRATFRARDDGTFRVVAPAPRHVDGDPLAAARAPLAAVDDHPDMPALRAAQQGDWHAFWDGWEPLRVSSDDGSGEYVEGLRTLHAYTQATSAQGTVPSTHGGIANLHSFSGDRHDWYPAGFWHWNQRMLTLANLGAGIEELNAPYFRLYLDNLEATRAWTAGHYTDVEGVCVPETIRFDGSGSYPDFELCDEDAPRYFTTRIHSTGAEVALHAWRQHLFTGDEAFLERAYPFLRDSALFLLTYADTDPLTGRLRFFPSNSSEAHWDALNPITDIAAAMTLWPVVIEAAELLDRDADVVDRLQEGLDRLPDLPRTGGPADVFLPADAFDVAINTHAVAQEPIWPFSLVDDGDDPLDVTARRTFELRPAAYRMTNAWTMEPVQAARLGLADEVRDLLLEGVERFQTFPSGYAFYMLPAEALEATQQFNGPYLEWNGVTGAALQEALVQRHDGLLRLAPAWPSAWDVAGSVRVEGGHRVSTEVVDGVPRFAAVTGGSDETVRLRNPWPGEPVRVRDGAAVVGGPTADDAVDLPVRAGRTLVVERVDAPVDALAVVPVCDRPAAGARTQGDRSVGLDADGQDPDPRRRTARSCRTSTSSACRARSAPPPPRPSRGPPGTRRRRSSSPGRTPTPTPWPVRRWPCTAMRRCCSRSATGCLPPPLRRSSGSAPRRRCCSAGRRPSRTTWPTTCGAAGCRCAASRARTASRRPRPSPTSCRPPTRSSSPRAPTRTPPGASPTRCRPPGWARPRSCPSCS